MRAEADDPVYAEGYRAGQIDAVRRLKSLADRFKHRTKKIERYEQELLAILRDPEKLVDAASADPEIESALTTAVMAMLMAESGAKPEEVLGA